MMKILWLSLLTFTILSCSSTPKEKTPEQKKAHIYYTQGTNLLLSGKYPDALKYLRLSAKFGPNETKTHNNLAMAYHYRKSSSKAILHLKKALEIDPKNMDAKQNLATIYMQQNQFLKAEQLYNDILSNLEYNDQVKTHYNLGVLYFKQKRYKESLNQFKSSIGVSQSYCPSHFKLGEIYKVHKKYTKALFHFKESGKGVCYSNLEPFKEQIIIKSLMHDFAGARKTHNDISERFSGLDEQNEIKKLKNYIDAKERQILSL